MSYDDHLDRYLAKVQAEEEARQKAQKEKEENIRNNREEAERLVTDVITPELKALAKSLQVKLGLSPVISPVEEHPNLENPPASIRLQIGRAPAIQFRAEVAKAQFEIKFDTQSHYGRVLASLDFRKTTRDSVQDLLGKFLHFAYPSQV